MCIKFHIFSLNSFLGFNLLSVDILLLLVYIYYCSYYCVHAGYTCAYVYIHVRTVLSLLVFLPCIFLLIFLLIFYLFRHKNVHMWTNKTIELTQSLNPRRRRNKNKQQSDRVRLPLLLLPVFGGGVLRRRCHVISRSVTTNNIQHGGVRPGEADRSVKLLV